MAKSKIGELVVSTVLSDLVGTIIEREANRPRHPDSPHHDQAWPVHDPNAAGEEIATIRAVWTEGGTLKVLAVSPSGYPFETYLSAGICKVYQR